jgi:hypothetical protein
MLNSDLIKQFGVGLIWLWLKERKKKLWSIKRKKRSEIEQSLEKYEWFQAILTYSINRLCFWNGVDRGQQAYY